MKKKITVKKRRSNPEKVTPTPTETPTDFTPTHLIFSDLHLDDRDTIEMFNGSRFSDGLAILDEIVTEAINNKLILLHLGDVFEKKDRLPGHLKNPFLDRVQLLNYNKIPNYWLMGNHDYQFIDSPPLQFINHYEYTSFIDAGQHVDNGFLIPYCEGDAKLAMIDTLNTLPDDTIIFLHGTIQGATWENDQEVLMESSDVWSMDVLSRFKLVFSGHVHKPQRIRDNIHMIGAPYHTSFNSSGVRQYVLLNMDTGQWKYVPLYGPEFVTVDMSNSATASIKGNYVRVKTEMTKADRKIFDLLALKEQMRESGAKGFCFACTTLDEHGKKDSRELGLTDDQIVQSVVDESSSNLDTAMLLTYGRQLLADQTP